MAVGEKNPGMERALSMTAPTPPAEIVPSTRIVIRAITITTACMKSEALSARKPPINVYTTTKMAPAIIMEW